MAGHRPLIDIHTNTPRLTKSRPVSRRCHRCRGTGRAPCPICGGSGEVMLRANPSGKPEFGRCNGCFGTKTRRCTCCSGAGLVEDPQPKSRMLR